VKLAEIRAVPEATEQDVDLGAAAPRPIQPTQQGIGKALLEHEQD
jgi:hypothetical protein